MAHVRKQIRDAIKTALTGLGMTGSNVEVNRDLILQDSDLPAIVINVRTDTPDYSEAQLGGIPQRILEVAIEGYVKAAPANVADDLDQINAEVETAIYVDQTFGGLAQGMEVGDVEIQSQADTDEPFGIISMTFIIYYYAREGAPETAI